MPGDAPLQPNPDEVLEPASRHILNAVPIGLLIVDPSRNLAFVNSAAERMFLYDQDGWKAQPLAALLPEAGTLIHSAAVPAQSQSAGRAVRLKALRKDKSEFSVDCTCSPLPTREPDWAILSVVPQADGQVSDLENPGGQGRFQAYWEAASEGLVAIGESGAIEMVNQAVERIFGYKRSELVGQRVEVLIPELQRRPHEEMRSGYFANPKMRTMGSGLKLFGRKKDGTSFPVEIGLNVARIGSANIAIAFVTDVTEKSRLEEHSSVLGALVDLQQQLGSPSVARSAAPSEVDPLTALGTTVTFERALASAMSAPHGRFCVIYSLQQLRRLETRHGRKTADRVVIFASQYIANSLRGDRDELFRWDDTSFVALLQRDMATVTEVRLEVTNDCGKRLEYFIGNTGSMILVDLQFHVLSLEKMSLEEVSAEVKRVTQLVSA